MALKLGDLSKVPPKQKAFLVVLVCLLMGAGYFYLYHREMGAQKNDLQRKLNELDGVIKMQSDIAKNLPSFKAEVRRLEEQLGLLLEQLPNSAEIPSLLKNVSDLGKESGLEFLKFAPGAEMRKDFYAVIPVTIAVNGDFHSFLLFADKVSHLPRIVNLSDVVFGNPKPIGEGQAMVNVAFTATTYRFLEQKPPEAPEAGKGKAK
ncbi:MAG: type 4a pilus biogenesis protein PilO [Deltaproteobacteria bacterium]|nr:type 4a pilus biogenesis protein PilO [Deltaproteobacteria bacterium]